MSEQAPPLTALELADFAVPLVSGVGVICEATMTLGDLLQNNTVAGGYHEMKLVAVAGLLAVYYRVTDTFRGRSTRQVPTSDEIVR